MFCVEMSISKLYHCGYEIQGKKGIDNTCYSIKFNAKRKPQQHHVVNEMDETENYLLLLEKKEAWISQAPL